MTNELLVILIALTGLLAWSWRRIWKLEESVVKLVAILESAHTSLILATCRLDMLELPMRCDSEEEARERALEIASDTLKKLGGRIPSGVEEALGEILEMGKEAR